MSKLSNFLKKKFKLVGIFASLLISSFTTSHFKAIKSSLAARLDLLNL